MSEPNTVLIQEICYSTRYATILWQGVEYEVFVAMPTKGKSVMLYCHVYCVTGLLWRVILDGTADLKEGQILVGKKLEKHC